MNTGFIDPNRLTKTKRDQEIPALRCPKCSKEWFEEVRVNKYQRDHYVLAGQEVPKVATFNFILLRCINCGNISEPNVQLTIYDSARQDYNNFQKSMDWKDDSVTEEKK